MDSKNTFVKMIEAMGSAYEEESGRTPEFILYTASGMVKGTLNSKMMDDFYRIGNNIANIDDPSEPYQRGDIVALKNVTIGFPAINAATIDEMYFHKDAILGFMIFDGTVDYSKCKLPQM